MTPALTKLAYTIFANLNSVNITDIERWMAEMEKLISAAIAGGLIYSNLTELNADLAHGPNTWAYVANDPTGANNGFYKKIGASGSGSWVKVTDFPSINGWSPILGVATDGARRVLQIVDWTGGDGTKPETGQYIGASGLTSTIASAVDVRGPQGLSGDGSGDMVAANNLSDVSSDAESRSNLSVPAYVATRSALKALDTSVEQVAILAEDGREGQFIFRSGDYSAEVAADTAEGLFVKANDTAAADGAWVRVVNGAVDPRWFGLKLDGDGAGGGTNDQAAFAAMLSALAAIGGGRVDGQGKIARLDTTVAGIGNLTLENITLDISNAPTSTWAMTFDGTLGSGVTISTAARGAGSVTTANTGSVAVGDWIYLRAADAFAQGGSYNGEFKQVKAVSANTSISFYDRLHDLYSTTPQYFHPALLENITLRNVTIIGGGTGSAHKGARFYLCRNVTVDNVVTRYCGERGIQFERSIDCTRIAGGGHHADAVGLSYGTVIGNGCFRAHVWGGAYSDLRHAVTIGGEDGVDWYVTVNGITATDCRDAAIDAHPQAAYVTITGNSIGHLSTTASTDGIVVQCANATVVGNTVHGASRTGILVQNLVSRASRADDLAVVSGNNVTFADGSATAYGIVFECQRATASWRFACANNVIDQVNASISYGIWIEVPTGVGAASIRGFSVTGNTVFSRRAALTVTTAGTQFVTAGVISGNTFETVDTSSYDVIDINAATSGYIERTNISGNTLIGGRYGINNTNGSRIGTGGNMIQSFGSTATNGTFVSTGTDYSS